MRREHNIEQGSILPSGYQQIDYIEGIGNQWIDTEYKPNNNTSIECDAQLTYVKKDNPKGGVFWVRWSTSPYYQFGMSDASSSDWQIYSYVFSNSYILTPNDPSYTASRHIFKIDQQNNVTSVDNYSTSLQSQSQSYQSSLNLALLGGNTMDSWGGSNGRMWYCKIWEGNNIIRNYIPAIRLSDNKVGLYDLAGSICSLTNTPFYINSGSGNFLMPAQIYSYTNLQYIQCTGTQYIDTEWLPNSNTEVIYNCKQTESYAYGTNQCFFGCSNGAWNNNPFTMCTYHNGAVSYGTSGSAGWECFTTTVGQDMVLKLNKNGGYVNDTMVFNTSSYVLNQMDQSLLFGAENYISVTEYGKHRIYSAQIYESGNLVRNFVPKLRNIDSKPGLYDTVNNLFYTNRGTGEFLYA
jgi:hypothetical protein